MIGPTQGVRFGVALRLGEYGIINNGKRLDFTCIAQPARSRPCMNDLSVRPIYPTFPKVDDKGGLRPGL
jgi:hypothetical protein